MNLQNKHHITETQVGWTLNLIKRILLLNHTHGDETVIEEYNNK